MAYDDENDRPTKEGEKKQRDGGMRNENRSPSKPKEKLRLAPAVASQTPGAVRVGKSGEVEKARDIEDKLRLAPGVATEMVIDDRNISQGRAHDIKNKLRLAPGAASKVPGAESVETMMNQKEVTKAQYKIDNKLRLAPGVATGNIGDRTSLQRAHDTQNKLRLAPGVPASETTDIANNGPKLRQAPGVATSDSTGAIREANNKLRLAPGVAPSGNPQSESQANNRSDEDELVEVEMATDVDDFVAQEAQRRMEEQRQQVVVATVRSEREGSSAGDPRKKKNRQLLIVAFGIISVVAITVGVWQALTNDESSDPVVPELTTSSPTATTAPSQTPTLSSVPSHAPTSLRDEVEAILSDYAPLDEETMTWLTETSTWEPGEDDPNYEYLWLERYVLGLLYHKTLGRRWHRSEGWLSDEPVCTWFSTQLQNCVDGPITVVNLRSNGLIGTLPTMIFELTALRTLDLSGNSLLSIGIPSSIGHLSQLAHLFFESTQLKSSIPLEIGNLSQLRDLSLGRNKLTSSIPSSIGNLSMLTVLSLNNNQLMSTIPSEIGNLTHLKKLDVSSNLMTSSIPSSVGKLTQLVDLYLFDNELTSSIPPTIGNLGQLISLILTNNQLTSSIPESMGDLGQLELLDFQNNLLTSSIPLSFGRLTKMTWLDLRHNNLSGSIPILPSIRICNLENNCFSDVTNAASIGCDIDPNCT